MCPAVNQRVSHCDLAHSTQCSSTVSPLSYVILTMSLSYTLCQPNKKQSQGRATTACLLSNQYNIVASLFGALSVVPFAVND